MKGVLWNNSAEKIKIRAHGVSLEPMLRQVSKLQRSKRQARFLKWQLQQNLVFTNFHLFNRPSSPKLARLFWISTALKKTVNNLAVGSWFPAVRTATSYKYWTWTARIFTKCTHSMTTVGYRQSGRVQASIRLCSNVVTSFSSQFATLSLVE